MDAGREYALFTRMSVCFERYDGRESWLPRDGGSLEMSLSYADDVGEAVWWVSAVVGAECRVVLRAIWSK